MKRTHNLFPRRFSSGLVGTLLLGPCLGLGGCHSPGGTHRERARLLTPLDSIAIGVQGVRRYMSQCDAPQREQIERTIELGSRVVVRVELTEPIEQGTSLSDAGTGILLGQTGAVLTAAHVLISSSPHEVLRLTRADGSSRVLETAHLDSRLWSENGQDLGVVATTWLGEQSVELADARPGELVVGLGYPGQFGLSKQDYVDDPGPNHRGLLPVPMLARVLSIRPLTLQMVAGTMPTGGTSGSPLLNLRGQCVGVLSGVSWVWDEDNAMTSTIQATELGESVRSVLGELPKRPSSPREEIGKPARADAP